MSIITLVLFALIGCKSNSQEDLRSDDFTKIDLPDSTTTSKDSVANAEDDKILTIFDKQIIFFMPSPEEKQELIKHYGYYIQYELQFVFTDFSKMVSKVKYAVKKHDLDIKVTYAKVFEFPLENDTVIYDLNTEKQIMGYILFDGKNKPLIKNGVQKHKDISNDIKQYFKLEQFKISE